MTRPPNSNRPLLAGIVQNSLAAGAAMAAVLLLCQGAFAQQASISEQYLAGLRERRFFQLAIEYAEQQLANSALSAEESLAITIELSRTHATVAMHRPPAARGAHWQQAESVLARYQTSRGGNAPELLIDLQRALNQLAAGELLRQEAEVGANTAEAFEPAREQLRTAIGGLEALEAQLATAGRDSSSARSAEERLALRDQIRWQLARARKNQALCYARGTADRVAALSAALESLAGLMRELPPESDLYWPCRLDSAQCQRLLENYDAAVSLVETILAGEVPAAIALRARGELAEIHLARGDFDAMLATLQRGRAIGEVTSAEYDLVYLRCYVAFWKQASEQNKPNDAAAWLAKAEQVAALMERTHGAYWRRRADMMLASAARGGDAGGNMSVLLRTADSLYVRKQYADAIAAYSDAATAAETAGDAATALEIWKKAAAVHQQREEFVQAAELLASAAARLAESSGADAAHLAAILLAARAAAADAARLDRYVELLAEHVARWPQADSANQVRLWQGKLFEHQGNWPAAASAYTGVTNAMPEEWLAAIAGAARAYEAQIASAANGRPLSEALHYFATVAATAAPRSDLAAVHAAATVQHARFELRYQGQADFRRAEHMLTQMLAAPAVSPEVAREAESLLIVALAAQPTRRKEALQRLRQAGGSQPQQLLALLDQLSKLAAGFPEAAGREISVLVLEVCNALLAQADELTEPQRDQIRRRQADALIATNRRQEALEIVRQLAVRHPRDASIQESYAELLIAADDRTSLTTALERWRFIGRHSPPASARWWKAKYNVALAHFRLGDTQQAAQVLRYAQATGAGKPERELAADIEALLKKCQ